MRSGKYVAAGLALSCLTLSPGLAHHSLAIYARNRAETVEGTVMTFGWSNPHVQLVVMAPDQGGILRRWNFEGGSISRLAMAGFNRNMVMPGDKITVTYNPRRDDIRGGFLLKIVSGNRTYDTSRNRGPTRGGAEEG